MKVSMNYCRSHDLHDKLHHQHKTYTTIAYEEKKDKLKWRHLKKQKWGKDCVKTNSAFEKFVARDTMDDTASCMDSLLGLTYRLKRGEQMKSVEKMFNHHQSNDNNAPIIFTTLDWQSQRSAIVHICHLVEIRFFFRCCCKSHRLVIGDIAMIIIIYPQILYVYDHRIKWTCFCHFSEIQKKRLLDNYPEPRTQNQYFQNVIDILSMHFK